MRSSSFFCPIGRRLDRPAMKELELTTPRCLLHHLERTRVQLKWTSISELGDTWQRFFCRLKFNLGCQNECHDLFPWS